MTDDQFEFHDIDDQLEPVGPGPIDPGFPWGGVITTLGLILVVVFAVQNTGSVEVRFLWVDGQFPLAMVILITALVAVIFTAVGGALYRRRRLRRRMEKEQLRQLRSDT